MNLQEEANLVLQDLVSLEKKTQAKFEAKKVDTLWMLNKEVSIWSWTSHGRGEIQRKKWDGEIV